MAKMTMYIPSLILIVILTNFQSVHLSREIKRISYSTRGIECRSPCLRHRAEYHSCYLVTSGWDYCSTSPLTDYKGNKCQNRCGLHGHSYKWCAIDDGSWGYCSPESTEVEVKHFGSTEGKQCSSACDQHSHSYFWCRTDNLNWDYCSPAKDVNSGGTKCKTECGKSQDTKYTWCYDENDKWQYCLKVEMIRMNTKTVAEAYRKPEEPSNLH